MMTADSANTSGLIKPFTAKVAATGIATAVISQNSHGLAWIVYQIGFALAQQAPSPSVAAHVNGVPLVSSAPMQISAFASIAGAAPYAMETFFYGPPYVTLEPGDQITCAVVGANSGDTFTVAAYVNEIVSPATQRAQNAAGGHASGYIARPQTGTSRWR
jgi:hypothetical protein